MVINKILNNNVIITCNDKNEEIIVMGRGIAYKKKVGNSVPEDMIDKVYTLSDENTSNRFKELISKIPLEYMKLSDEVISYAESKLGKKLNESIYISLTDHIHTAIERFKNGITMKNALLWDTRRFYKEELNVGMKALDLIEEKFDLRLADDEAGFIAWHIVNAQMDESVKDIYEITKIMQEISNIVKYYFGITFNEESVYFYRFITHLKFFAERLVNGNTFKSNDSDDLLDTIKVKYKNAYSCVEKIGEFIKNKYNYNISNEEMLYLIIHIERIVSKTE